MVVNAQVPPGSDTCEAAAVINTLPFELLDGTLEGRQGSGGAENPATVCSLFAGTPEDYPILWYEVDLDDDYVDPCLCLELRSNDNAFIVGLLNNNSQDPETCDSMFCRETTDFTSASLVWRNTRAVETYSRSLVCLDRRTRPGNL